MAEFPTADGCNPDPGVRDGEALPLTHERAAWVPAAANLHSACCSPRVSFICCLLAGWALAPSLTYYGQFAAENGRLGQLARENGLTAKRPYRTAAIRAASEAPGTNDKMPEPQKQPDSTRSAPPDTTPYVRPTIPEDYAPGGTEVHPGVRTPFQKQDDHRSPSTRHGEPKAKSRSPR